MEVFMSANILINHPEMPPDSRLLHWPSRTNNLKPNLDKRSIDHLMKITAVTNVYFPLLNMCTLLKALLRDIYTKPKLVQCFHVV